MRTVFFAWMILAPAVGADELPQLSEEPWSGWFSGVNASGFRFGVMEGGEGVLVPAKSRKEDESKAYWLQIEPGIDEVLPDGKVVAKKVLEDGFTPLTDGSSEAEEIAYEATVTGGAKFEARFAIDRDEITAGGKLLDHGELTSNPIRFVIRVKIPNGYKYSANYAAVEDKARRDKLELVLTDLKKVRVGSLENVDGEELTGAGIAEATIDFEGLKTSGIELSASRGSLFHLSTGGLKQPLWRGFTLTWMSDSEKDPEGKSTFSMTYK